MIKNNLANIIFVISSLLVIFFIHPILSIILGILFATFFKDKAMVITKKIGSYPLQIGIEIGRASCRERV